MDFDLTEEQQLFQKTVRDFTEREINPRARQMDREGKLPDDLIKKMAELKLLGMTLPVEYGGIGAGSLDCILAIEQISYSGTGAWWLLAFCNSIPETIFKFGTEDQKESYLPPVCRGDIYPSIQFTEADTGSNPDALTLTARSSGNSFIINGMKRFSTFGAREGYAVLYAKDEEGECTAFIAEKNIEGYSTSQLYDLMGSGGIEATDVYFENVILPSERVLGSNRNGLEVLQSWISDEKILQCGACLGIAQAALDEAISYSKKRQVKGRPQSDLQGIRWMIAEMYAKLEAARWLTYRSALLKDRSLKDWMTEASAAKLFVVPATMDVVNMARMIHGSYGYTKEFKIERLYRAIAGASAIAVSLEINKSIVAASLFKQEKTRDSV